MRPEVSLRAICLAICLAAAEVGLAQASASRSVPPRIPLDQFPMQLTGWNGTGESRLDDKVLEQLRVSDYLNRFYSAADAPAVPVNLYVGYYSQQSNGETMHSPLNCLPGSGWQPVQHSRLTVNVPSGEPGAAGTAAMRPIEINQYLVQKGGDYTMVLYWYQSHNRVVASEYWGKFYTVLDAIRWHRSDAALVRVVVPVNQSGSMITAETEAHAEALGTGLIRAMFPVLVRHFPA